MALRPPFRTSSILATLLVAVALFSLFAVPARAQPLELPRARAATPEASIQDPSAAAPPAAPAQTPPPLSDSLRKDIKGLLSTLKDDESRADLITNLQTLLRVADPLAHQGARNDWLTGATRGLGQFSSSVLALVIEIRNLPQLLVQVFANLSDPRVIENISWATGMVAAVLAAALAVEWLVKWLLRRPRRAVEAQNSASLVARLAWLCLRTLLDVLPIAAFAATAFGVLAFADLTFAVRLAVVTVINANVLARSVLAAARAVLTPSLPRLRLVPLGDEGAAYCFLWVRRFTYTAVYGYFLLRAAWILGLSSAAHGMLLDLLAFIIASMAVVLILQIRRPVARQLRKVSAAGGQMTLLRNQIAEFWHLFAIAYVVAVFMVWALGIEGGTAFIAQASILSLITILAARALMLVLMRVGKAVFRLNDTVREEFPQLEARANRYLPILRHGVGLLITAVTTLILLEIWGAEPFDWLATDHGEDLLGRAIAICIVVAGGFAAWEVGIAFADRLYERNPASNRVKTLLPFLQNGFRIVLVTIAGLIVLSELGVNIGPLLAGAGVLGLAIGFGAQTMVKDVITGIFILMEDTLSVGDVVELGAHAGLVEKITVRTVHLRDFDGNVHSLPFGEVQIIKNMSKQFAYAVVDVSVSYRENIDEALAVMAEVAEEMASTGPLAETIIGPFELMGVEGLQDSAVWLRGRFKTRPLGQWNVKREFYRRIKAAFDARDIRIPFPHQTIYFGVDKKGEAPPVHVVMETGARRAAPKGSRAPVPPVVQTPGPLVEEHPGARERTDEDLEEAMPAGGDPTAGRVS
ncbi:mechanosensitive ion channel family protein [Xanthobacter sp. ZOL 2024]